MSNALRLDQAVTALAQLPEAQQRRVVPAMAKKPAAWKGRRQNKYRPGPKIRDMAELSAHLDAGRYVYWNHKPQHPSWLASMTYHTLRGAVRKGILRIAITQESA